MNLSDSQLELICSEISTNIIGFPDNFKNHYEKVYENKTKGLVEQVAEALSDTISEYADSEIYENYNFKVSEVGQNGYELLVGHK